jgi:hypothetical protein
MRGLAGRHEPKYSWRRGLILVRSFTSSKNTVTLIPSTNAASSVAGTCFKDAVRPDDDVVATNKLEILIKRDHAADKQQVAELDGIDAGAKPEIRISWRRYLGCAQSGFCARFSDPSGRFLDFPDGHGCPSKYLVEVSNHAVSDLSMC